MNIDEASFWIGTTALVYTVVKSISKTRDEQTANDREALQALSDAYHATNKYYDTIDVHSEDRSQQWDIAHKWDRVGRLLKDRDPVLASRLDAKSRYWREGATWDAKLIQDAGIGLDSVWREVQIRLET